MHYPLYHIYSGEVIFIYIYLLGSQMKCADYSKILPKYFQSMKKQINKWKKK